jgi:hypothetical protein
MGRDVCIVIYIGRDVTSEEEEAIKSTLDNGESVSLGYKDSPIKLDGYNVAYDEITEEYVVCQYYIGYLSSYDIDQSLQDGIDYDFPKPHDDRYKLRFRYQYGGLR